MAPVSYANLVMLGPAPGTRGGVAGVVETYRAHGVMSRWPVDYIATDGGGSPARRAGFALKAVGRLGALLVRQRGAVLHIHTAPRARFWRDAVYMSMALAARCPTIIHLHGGGFDRLYDASGMAGQSFIRQLLERALCVALPSQRMAARIHSVSPAVRVVSLPPAVATGPLQSPARQNLILFLGRLHRDKGIFDLVDALSRLRADVPDLRLVCAGAGDRRPVARYAERLGIADAVRFTGWVGPSGKRALLETAAVFALPSYSEGVPLSLLEAMAAGTPVVASAVGGIPDAVVDGTSGLLAAPGDTATLQRLLRKVLLDRALAARIGAAARKTAAARFSAEQALSRLEALYAEIGIEPTHLKSSIWPASQAG